MRASNLLRCTIVLFLSFGLPNPANSAITDTATVLAQASQAFSASKPVASETMTGTAQWFTVLEKDSDAVKLTANVVGPSITGQSAPVSNGAALDAGIAIPVSTGVLGQHDDAALKEIAAHLAVVGATPWLGMQGTGQIVYGSKDPTAYSATLSMIGSDQLRLKSRLDAQTNKGEMSIRIHGQVGKIQGTGGPTQTIPPDTAIAGIFPFGLVRTLHSPGTSLIDHGLTTVGGVQLHRISVETPSTGPIN